jgi:signal recognition particle subunit SRP54
MCEKLNQLETFYHRRLASRILGKRRRNFARREGSKLKRISLRRENKKNEFDFEDFLKQIKAIKKMGSLSSLIGMLPGRWCTKKFKLMTMLL